jgi:apolipoprotein N-acyltransferase
MALSLILVLLIGAVLPFAFAPLGIYTLAFIVPTLLLYHWQKSTPFQAFIKGGVFGLGFYSVGVSWVYISIHTYGNASTLVAALITFAMIAVLSFGPAAQGYLLMRFFGKQSPVKLYLGAFPATWVIWEYLRSLPFNGFPWLFLGYSQLTTPLRGLAPIFGVYGVSLAVAFICGCLLLITTRQSLKIKLNALLAFLAIVAISWGLSLIDWTKSKGQALTVSLVQANIGQSLKWQPEQFTHIVQTYESLTDPYWQNSRLIVWPEAALPAFPDQIPQIITGLQETSAKNNTTLLLGILLGDPYQKYFNGILLLGADQGEYRKRHLVPFGEYMPLKSVFSFLIHYWNIPMSDFTAGANHQNSLKIGNLNLAAFICYEIAYPLLVLKYTQGSDLIVNISDDSWFGQSMASFQQMQMAQMRALETGRYVLSAANTGVTGIINPQGKIISALPSHQVGVLHATVNAMQGQTPLMQTNYYPVLAIIICLLLFGSGIFSKKLGKK